MHELLVRSVCRGAGDAAILSFMEAPPPRLGVLELFLALSNAHSMPDSAKDWLTALANMLASGPNAEIGLK